MNFWVNKPTIVILFFIMCLFTACTDKNSPFGAPDPDLVFNEITLPDSYITNIYTYRDSVESFMQTRNFAARYIGLANMIPYNHKLILGNYNNTDIRTLIRFDIVNADTSFVNDPEVTLYINHIENPQNQEYTIKIAPVKNIFDLYATWEKFAEASIDKWEVEGGDFNKEDIFEYSFSTIDSTGQNINKLTFPIDKDKMKKWLTEEDSNNFGLILMTENLNDTFIEFHSRNYDITTLRPQIKLIFDDDEEKNVSATQSVYIHDYKEDETTQYLRDLLYISNIIPRSFFIQLADLDSLFTLFPEISNQQGLKRINILQANLVFSLNQNNSLMTNKTIDIVPTIPDDTFDLEHPQDKFDYTRWYFYPQDRTTAAYDEDTDIMIIKITSPMRAFISGIRENRGIGFINLQRSMDFSYLNLYGKDAEVNKKPKIVIKYSYKKRIKEITK